MLINPNTYVVIRNCPINDGQIACDQLNSNLKFVQELGNFKGDNLQVAFATFANKGLIEPKGFFESDTLTFSNLTKYYWGNTQ